MVKQVRTELISRTRDGVLMYPGVSILTYAKAPGMPWVLLKIESDDRPR